MLDDGSQKWWRFSAYEVRDTRIRPVRGARLLTYDPWKLQATARGDSKGSPYEDLLNLREQLEVSHADGSLGPLPETLPRAEAVTHLTEDSKKLIVEWCNQNGLLGILLQNTLSINLAPRWTRFEGVIKPVQRIYFRTNDGWNVLALASNHPYPDAGEEQLGHLVPEDVYGDKHTVGTLAAPYSPRFYRLSRLAPFFPEVTPEVAETYWYPEPLSRKFWDQYAEPVGAFVEGIETLAKAVLSPRTMVTRGRPSPADSPDIARACVVMSRLLTSVGPVLEFDGTTAFAQRWRWGSLLGAFALMATADLVKHGPPQSCATCGSWFVRQRRDTLYCSPTCRWTKQKQRHRSRAK